MNTSENVDQVFTALAAAQADLQNPNKTKTAKVKGVSKTGRDYEMTYKYADIADVLNDARPVLAKHGLCIVQATGIDGGALLVRTRLGHNSGQWVESEYPVSAVNGDHQKMGAALTYSRRYALCAMIGVAAEEDLDGQHAAEPEKPVKSSYRAKQEGLGPRADALIHELRETIDEVELAQWGKDHADEIAGLADNWQKMIREEFAEQRIRLRATGMDDALRATVGSSGGSAASVSGRNGQVEAA